MHPVQESLPCTGRGIWCDGLFHAHAVQALRQHTDHAVADALLLGLQEDLGVDGEEMSMDWDDVELQYKT